MKLSILSTLLLTITTASAFTLSSPTSSSTISSPTSFSSSSKSIVSQHQQQQNEHRHQQSKLSAAAIEADAQSMSDEDRLKLEEEWLVQLQSSQVQEVRMELIEKYLSAGREMEFAEKEVDKFLSDPERSLKYLEMRSYAKAQNELGFEGVIQLGAAFAIGLVGNVGVKYFTAWRQASPDHDIFQFFN